jgi:hypothetical protein
MILVRELVLRDQISVSTTARVNLFIHNKMTPSPHHEQQTQQQQQQQQPPRQKICTVVTDCQVCTGEDQHEIPECKFTGHRIVYFCKLYDGGKVFWGGN